MTKKSIKIVIAGRNYPLTINESEEDAVFKAVEEINTNIQRLQESYAVKDMQDLLAMTSLQLATRSNSEKARVSSKEEEKVSKEETLKALQILSDSIDM